MNLIVGLDVGGSTTKIVGMDNGEIIYKAVVKAADPITSSYGAVGKLINDMKLSLEDIKRINITGVGSGFPNGNILGIDTVMISEFDATGMGGLYVAGLKKAVVVSMGTGTAYIEADGTSVKHIIGSGIGGGTMVGLCNSMIGVDDAIKLSEIAAEGDLLSVDLTIGDISKSEIPGLPEHVTASNFGKVADDLSREDKAAGVFNLVYQSIGTCAVLASRLCGVKDIVFTGQLTSLAQCEEVFSGFSELYNVNCIIPADSVYATAIGACLAG